MKRLLIIIGIMCVILFAGALFCPGQSVPWVTRAYENSRSGWNSTETTLTQDSIIKRGVSLRGIIPLCCDARGMEAQPLIATNVNGHDMMILATMSDAVIAVDVHTGQKLWGSAPDSALKSNNPYVLSDGVLQLGVPITADRSIDMWQINQHMGCMSTGVINNSSKILYQSCWVSQDGSGTPKSGRYEMFVINLVNGSYVTPPVPLQGSDTSMWKQRSALVMTKANGCTVFVAHGSIYETFTGYTGGITAFDCTMNEVTAQLPLTAGIWMAGQGLIADDQGYLYAITGNGDFDPAEGFYGESFIKVRYTVVDPTKVPKQNWGLKVIDDWSPWNDYQRAGKKAPIPITLNASSLSAGLQKQSGVSQPSEAVRPVGSNMTPAMAAGKVVADVDAQAQIVTRVYPMAGGAWADEDWGSAGPACIFEILTCVATGKDGIAYPINSYHLGQTTAANVGTAANYAKLRSKCAWLTMSPGNVPCDPTDATKLNFMPNGKTAHLHMTPPHFYDPVLKSWVIMPWGENSALHKWKVSDTGRLTYVAEGQEYASSQNVRSPGGMPGGFCTGSSNGNQENSAILVCSIPYGDANRTVTDGRLLIYDPIHLTADGHLKVLWDSQQWGIAYKYNKFMAPVIDGGDIILPDYAGRVLVFRM